MAREDWMKKLEVSLRFKRKGLKYLETLTSAVTTAWGVDWDEDYIARDIMQNFFDANRGSLREVKVKVDGSDVTISAPSPFNLERLYYLGSEKGEDDVGQYGEGAKAAIINLLRDHNVEPIAVSGDRCVHAHLSDELVGDTGLRPVKYDYYRLPEAYAGTLLLLPGCSATLVSSLQNGMTHFLYNDNPLIGAELWSSPDGGFIVYESRGTNGYAFYRNLKRGEISGIPLILVITGRHAKMEQLTRRDRDRNAFGEDLMKTFYKLFVKTGINGSRDCARLILESSRPCWVKGHPLLGTLAASSWRHRRTGYRYSLNKQSLWSKAETAEVFGERYFARSETFSQSRRLEYRRLERGWAGNGRIRLKSCFRHFGVLNAEDYCFERWEEDAKGRQRTPTPAEAECIEILVRVLKDLTPEGMLVLGRSQFTYAVYTSEYFHGELEKHRTYGSFEVFLEEAVFVSDFAHAYAVFVHEHAHVFGYDGSRGFTDALTDLLETTVRNRHLLDGYEKAWDAARVQVIGEREV